MYTTENYNYSYWQFSKLPRVPGGIFSVIGLALLDCVSRAHEIEICPSSVRVAIISVPNSIMGGFVSVVASPGPYGRTFY